MSTLTEAPPPLTPAAPDGANGWYRTNVSVDWTVSDPESSAALQGCGCKVV